MSDQNIKDHNKEAWNRQVQMGIRWTVPVGESEVEEAKSSGHPKVLLSPVKPVPKTWYENWANKKVLLLAGGGGQQSALLAAAGAQVWVVDISDEQLKQDQKVAKEFGLDIKTIDSSADDLSMLEDGYFDIIVNPLSNCFFEKLEPVWRECARVLRPGGKLMYAFNNPIAYLFDFKKANRGEYTLKYSQPYSDTLSLDDKEKEMFLSKDSPLEFGHELSTQMGAMLRCGFVINDLFEDYWSEDRNESHDLHFAQFINVLATKLPLNL